MPEDLEGCYRLAVETFERLVGEQFAVLTTVSVRLSMGLLAGARDAIFTHSLRSCDAVMLALADEAAARGHCQKRPGGSRRRPCSGIKKQMSHDWSPDSLSNKQIGVHLFISERTVESYVRSILNKLGFNSRAQIAGWMASSNQ